MTQKDNDFLKKLLSTFKVEAQEHINTISLGLIELEKASTSEKWMEVTEVIFREAHSLKGAARAVSMTDMEAICQSLESVFAALKRQEIALSPELFDLFHQANDSLDRLLSATRGEPALEKSKLTDLIQRLKEAAEGSGGGDRGTTVEDQRRAVRKPKAVVREQVAEAGEELQPNPDTNLPSPDIRLQSPSLTETVRIATAKLTPVLLQAEELLLAKLAAGQRVTELQEVNSALNTWKRQWSKVRPGVQKVQRLLEKEDKRNSTDKANSQFNKLFEFLDWNHTYIESLGGKLAVLTKSAKRDHHSFGSIVDNLLEDTKKMLMFPFSSLLESFPKLVRDLSRDQNKEAELVIRGGEVEIDRRILEEMKGPLIHLVRNCIDHGIEKSEERARKKKPPRGNIAMAISPRNGSNVEIVISDDGAGINIDKVRAASLKFGVISPGEAERLTELEVLSLIYKSGVSTSPIVTDVSGRGLGLAIVREKVEKLGGTISFETHLDAGTTFRIVLPLTLATFRGVQVRVDEHFFIIPSASVERVVRVNREEIKTVENRETVQLNGQAVSLVRLAEVLELFQGNGPGNPSDIVQMVILGSAEKRIAFAVDEILNEQEVLVKRLGKQLSRVRNIAGATVLGNGKIVPILNIPDLMKSAVKVAAVPARAPVTEEEGKAKRKTILVVEDSITARTLLKNILESAGYHVKTTVDGVDAFTVLKMESFDLVVSDVDMPRMNGFDLTAKIRSDKKLTELPVVLVTALESREDRERGIEVGANAYIVKSSFDQSNLLEVIKRLI